MKQIKETRKALVRQKVIVAAVAAACSVSALAFEFELDGGWKGSLNTTVTAASSWRVEGQDKSLTLNNAGPLGLAERNAMIDLHVLARLIHVLALVHWIGGVAMVTLVIMPQMRTLPAA